MSDLKKKYDAIGKNKPMNKLTSDDKKVLVKWHLMEAKDNFGMALMFAEDLGYDMLKEAMSDAKDMVFDVEEKGIDIGSFN